MAPPLLTLSLLLLLLGGTVTGSHIAFFIPVGSYSHRVSLWSLVAKLVEKGHQVTFISAYEPKTPLPNVTELVPTVMAKMANDYMQGGELDVTRRISGQLEPCYDHGPKLGLDTCRIFLDDPKVKEWFKSDPQIDLFVVDWFLSECILGLAHKLKAPYIFYSPTVMVGYFYDTFGILPDTAGIPDFELHYTPPMTFWQRAKNMVKPLIWKWKMSWYFQELGDLIKEKMNLPDLPPIEEMVRGASLMMWSESVVEGYPVQLPPNWVQVAGMHCKENTKPLPKDLEQVVQRGKDGFIYMSLGSAVVPANLPRGHRLAFFEAIRAFPNIQFLWKWTGTMPPKEEVPPNLHLGTWFPQQDILAHKRILAFVTQAGRPSTQEAIFFGVPIIALPVFEDQDFTAGRVRDNGGGLVLEIADIKKTEFEDAIREITTNPKYKQRMIRLQQIFRDRPMKPADTALFWVEYVLRHKGDLDHFRTPSYHLTWYERRHVDVWTAVILAFLLLAGIPIHILTYTFRALFFRKNNVQTKKKRKSKKDD